MTFTAFGKSAYSTIDFTDERIFRIHAFAFGDIVNTILLTAELAASALQHTTVSEIHIIAIAFFVAVYDAITAIASCSYSCFSRIRAKAKKKT
jgi:hypothetical protein